MHNNADGVSHAAAGLERVGRDAAHVGQECHDRVEMLGFVKGRRAPRSIVALSNALVARRGPPKGQRSFCCQDDRPPPPLRNPVVRRVQDAPIRTVACLLHPWEGVGAAPRRPHRQAARTSSWCTAASARVRPSAMITAGDMRDGVCSCVAGAAPAPPKVQTQTAQRVGLARRRLEPA